MGKFWKRTLCAAMTAGMCMSMACAEEVLTGERVFQIEQQLYGLGYHGESCDSQLDEGTRRALRSFQTANGLNQTGEPDSATLKLLDSGTGVTCHAYLVSVSQEYAGQPILQAGSAGDAVLWMQKALKELGYFTGGCDGVFGDATEIAVRNFQMAHGLMETGMADQSVQMRLYEGSPLTWQVFLENSCAAMGDSGVHVRRLQRELRKMGYFKGDCTGSYGDMTWQAVSRFQTANELEVTGDADMDTCVRLYSGSAVTVRQADTLSAGDSSEEVTRLQQQLSALGYFSAASTGFYGATTETAVRLFQMANGLPSTGAADAQTQKRMAEGSVLTLEQAKNGFNQILSTQDGVARAVVGNVAARMRGQAFDAGEEEMFRGFAFVQYVCAAAGVPVVSPEALVERVTIPVDDYEEPEAGELLVFRKDDAEGVHLMLAVSMGEGRIVYATADNGWVLESHLDKIQGADIYRWDLRTYAE